MKCPHCGAENAILRVAETVNEQDYLEALREQGQSQTTEAPVSLRCDGCGAQVRKPAHLDALPCPFCGKSVVAVAESRRLIKPRSLLPFHLTARQAGDLFRKWIESLWFAPSALKRMARQDQPIRGVYLPYWTYDCRSATAYTGMRGDDYWTTETYHTTVNGKRVTRTRQVRRTRWRPVSGQVQCRFDDVLVPATRSLPPKLTDALEPWDLARLQPYQDDYLSGFTAENYQIDLEQGFTEAQARMQPTIDAAIRRDIGGDHQRIGSKHNRYSDVTFKHLLLPVWLSAYRYQQRVYRFMVNARTGEVQGERPWSALKIALAIVAGLLLVALLAAAVVALTQA